MKYLCLLWIFFFAVAVIAEEKQPNNEDCPCIGSLKSTKRKLNYLQYGIKDYRIADIKALYNWPFQPFGQPFPLGHVSHSYQHYSGQPYFHHGIDIRVMYGNVVYSSTGGKVVNIENYVSGNSLYWEVAILDDNGFLWQYHHIDRATIPQAIFDVYKSGERINSGTNIGKVVYWPASAYGKNFHHIHVNVLDGNGNFLNPLLFLIQPLDLTPPTIEEVYFVNNESNNAISSNSLSGDIDIIVKAKDLMDGQPYELTIHSLSYEIRSAKGTHGVPKTTLWRFDRLPGGSDINKDVYTVFKETFRANGVTYRTSGNYSSRNFYYVVSNHQDGMVNKSGCWKTSAKNTKGEIMFPNGSYYITISASDFNGNTTSKTVEVTVNN